MDSESTGNDRQRAALRQRLRQARHAFANGVDAQRAQESLAAHLAPLLRTLEPQGLGLYWPVFGEFNAVAMWQADEYLRAIEASLPFAQRRPPSMHYRLWDGSAPSAIDECSIPVASGPPTEPDVVLVPCVGFTRSGYRLGYGGGYFDRWLAAHPGVTSVGVAWSQGLIDETEFAVQPHDIAMTLVVTEQGVVG